MAKTFPHRCLILFALSLLISATNYFTPKALAEPYLEKGIALYSQGNFKAAAPYMDYAVKQSTNDSTAYYYAAMTYHQLGLRNQAVAYYRQIMEKFPTSDAATRARTALTVLDPAYISRHAGTSSGGSNNTPDAKAHSAFSSDFSKLPDQGRIYFQRQGGVLMVDAELNNRSTKMIFDTGAEGCLFGKNQLAQLGISPPQGAAQGKSHGVGSSKGQDMWIMNVDLKVGNIVRKNFPIGVQESLETEPLLGQTFFSDFTYTIDNGANSIAYAKKHIAQQKGGQAKPGASAQKDNYSVPFTREGKELIVNAEVNGKACKMIFDTGASGTAFSKYQLEKLGIPIPDDAEEGTGSGIGGATKSMMFNLSRVKLGPIDKSALRISVPEQASLPRPLLGQNFYGDWQYTIENTSPSEGYIKFMRR